MPVSAVRTWHRASSLEPNIQDILAVVAAVAIQTFIWEADFGQCKRRLAGGRETIGVTPDTVMLPRVRSERRTRSSR